MRVLMTADAVGGVWTYAVDLIREYRSFRVDVDLAVMGPLPSPAQRLELAELDNVRLHAGEFKLEWMDQPWEDVAAAGRWLLRLEAETCPDVIHLNGYAHGQIPFRAPKLVVAHSCVLSWWQAVKNEPAPDSRQTYRREIDRGLRQADLVVAPTRAMLDCVAVHYGAPASARVIFNGRRPTDCGVAEKEPFVFAAGRVWDEAKNIRSLAKVAPRIPWPVFVAGDSRGPDGEAHHAQRVRMLGVLPSRAIADWFSRASIYALPARYEPFGLSILEAAMSGCALVVGGIDSLREVWADAAVYVDPDDESELAQKITDLIGDPDRLADYRRRARDRAKRFSSRAMAEEYLAAYRQILDRRAVAA